MEVIDQTIVNLESLCSTGDIIGDRLRMVPQSFEKDDDANGHIDFITAVSVSHGHISMVISPW